MLDDIDAEWLLQECIGRGFRAIEQYKARPRRHARDRDRPCLIRLDYNARFGERGEEFWGDVARLIDRAFETADFSPGQKFSELLGDLWKEAIDRERMAFVASLTKRTERGILC